MIKARQRPKLERYDGILFVVLRPARYVDESETVEFGEIHAFVGENFVVTVRHGEASTLDRVRRRLEYMPKLLHWLLGYRLALLLICVSLYAIFKKRGWL